MGQGVVTDRSQDFSKVQIFTGGVAGGHTKKYSESDTLVHDPVVVVDSSAAQVDLKLPDAKVDGFEMLVVCSVAGNDVVIEPSSLVGGATITLDAVGDSVCLKFSKKAGGWVVLGGHNYLLA